MRKYSIAFNSPIPSLPVHSVKYLNGEWKFFYSVEINGVNVFPVRLLVYGHISDLTLANQDGFEEISSNVRFNKEIMNEFELIDFLENDYRELLMSQCEFDKLSRDIFIKTYKKKYGVEPEVKQTFCLKNEKYTFNGEVLISGILEQNEKETIFKGVKR